MATGTVHTATLAANGVTTKFRVDGLAAGSISAFQSGKTATLTAGTTAIPLSFASAAVAAGTAVLSDTFTAANGTDVNGRTPSPTQPGSATWVEDGPSTGDLTIESNVVQISTAGTNAAKNLTIDTGQTDCVIEAPIKCGANTNRYYYIYLRYVDANNWVRLRIKARAAEQLLQENNAGSISTIATASSPHTTVNAQTDTWVVTVSGTSIDVSVGGTAIFTGETFTLHTSDTHQGWGVDGDSATFPVARLESITVGPTAAEITCTASSPGLSGETVTLSADAGLVNDGSNGSLVASGVSVTNSSTQSPETGVAVASMALADSDTIRLTLTTTTVLWGTVTLDANDVSVWAVKGYGHPTVSTLNNAQGEGTTTLTVDINLSRTPYSDEWLDIETRTGWLTDDRGNTAEVSWSLTGQTRLDLSTGATPPATTTVVSNGRTSVTLGTAAAVSWYLDGVPSIVVPTTNTITAESPTRTTAGGGEAIHGAMLNPATRNTQALDERNSGYSAGALPALPVTIDAGDSYIKASCESDADSETLDGATSTYPSLVRSYGIYHVVASAPGATEVAPPAFGYAGTGRPTLTIDLDAIYAALPAKSLSGVSGTVPDKDYWVSRVCQSNCGRYLMKSDPMWALVPTYYTDNGFTGYGQYQSQAIANIFIHLMGDQATEAEKKFMAAWICHHGVQTWYMSASSAGNRINPNGGQEPGSAAAIVAALYWTGNTNDIATLTSERHLNEFGQTYFWSQAEIDRYNTTHTQGDADGYPLDDAYCFMRRAHTIATGGVSGNVITLDTLHNYYFEIDFDSGAGGAGLRLTNGTQTTEITAHTRYDEFFTVADATGFAAGQTVYLEGYSGALPAIGTPGWGIVHADEPDRTWYAGQHTYQALNLWSMQVMFVQYLGAPGGLANDPWIREAVEVNADTSYLGAYSVGVKRHESTYAGNFWDAYEAEALAATAPTITSIDPATVPLGASGTWTITGTGFVDGITPTVDGGATLGATIWNSATEIEVDYTGSTAGTGWTLTLTNPDGQTGTITFDVVAAKGAGAAIARNASLGVAPLRGYPL